MQLCVRVAAGLSAHQHHEEEAELQSAPPPRQRRPQPSDPVGEALGVAPAEAHVLTRPLSLFRRETFITVPSCPPQAQEGGEDGEGGEAARRTPARPDCVQGDSNRV